MKKETDDERIDREIKAVIEIIKSDYPNASDYNVIEGSEDVEILDKDDRRIAVINTWKLTRYWNLMEGWL